MMQHRLKLPLATTLIAMNICLLSASCSGQSENLMAVDEARLGTGGDLAKYHYLVREPYSIGLNHEGFIVGIEKSPVEDIGYPCEDIGCRSGREFDDKRFKEWERTGDPNVDRYIEARNDHFRRVTSDPKAAYVSHVLEYGPDEKGTARFSVSPIYLAYRTSGFADVADKEPAECQAPEDGIPKYYDDGWCALDRLYDRVKAKLDCANNPKSDCANNPKSDCANNPKSDCTPKSKRYTHIIVATMGWNNDQVESVRRYNSLAGNVIAAARTDSSKIGDTKIGDTKIGDAFNPLIIGLTWPSVWGGDSFFNTINLFNHAISYPNKANDADEIGYTIANYLVNDIVHKLKREFNLKVVLIGHSLGARVMSRAMFSAHLLKNRPEPEKVNSKEKAATDLMLNLQGAYSVRRFKENHRLGIPISWFRKGEGSPYLIHRNLLARIVLTWSKYDTANPLAQWLTGAAHVGGEVGHEVSRKEIGNTFTYLNWDDKQKAFVDSDTGARSSCAEQKKDEKVLMVNANSIVSEHNDILDLQMGRLIWDTIACFAPPEARPPN